MIKRLQGAILITILYVSTGTVEPEALNALAESSSAWLRDVVQSGKLDDVQAQIGALSSNLFELSSMAGNLRGNPAN